MLMLITPLSAKYPMEVSFSINLCEKCSSNHYDQQQKFGTSRHSYPSNIDVFLNVQILHSVHVQNQQLNNSGRIPRPSYLKLQVADLNFDTRTNNHYHHYVLGT